MSHEQAIILSELTVRLFALCQEREANFVSRYGAKVSEFRCLHVLLENNHIPVKKLATLLHNTPSRLTRVVDSLISKGLVQRSEPQSDRRIKIISLTPKGEKLTKIMKKDFDTMHTEILSEIKDDSHEKIVASLERLIAAMENWNEKHEFENKSRGQK